jgi:hypothetical protein
MKEHVKPVIKTAFVLTIIAASGALLIAGANMLTSPIIARNEAKKEADALQKVFGDDAIFAEPKNIENSANLFRFYDASYSGGEGRVYKASGRNGYGEIDMLIGLKNDCSLYNFFVLNNGQSYGTTLQENYLTPIRLADDKDTAYNNVSCGATFGAKLVKQLIDASKEHYRVDLGVQHGK